MLNKLNQLGVFSNQSLPTSHAHVPPVIHVEADRNLRVRVTAFISQGRCDRQELLDLPS